MTTLFMDVSPLLFTVICIRRHALASLLSLGMLRNKLTRTSACYMYVCGLELHSGNARRVRLNNALERVKAVACTLVRVVRARPARQGDVPRGR